MLKVTEAFSYKGLSYEVDDIIGGIGEADILKNRSDYVTDVTAEITAVHDKTAKDMADAAEKEASAAAEKEAADAKEAAAKADVPVKAVTP